MRLHRLILLMRSYDQVMKHEKKIIHFSHAGVENRINAIQTKN